MRGALFAVVGASGAGKDMLLDGLCAARPDIHRARRTISRPAAESEEFESVSAAEYEALSKAGAFALEWRAHGLGYGIRHAQLAALAEERTVVFNGSRKALPAILARYPDLKVVEVVVSPAVLAERLAARGRESAEEIALRLERAALPLPGGLVARRVVNDTTPEAGVAALVAALQPMSR